MATQRFTLNDLRLTCLRIAGDLEMLAVCKDRGNDDAAAALKDSVKAGMATIAKVYAGMGS